MHPNDDDVLTGVMGPTGSGKYSFINLISGSNLRVGEDLKSCTKAVETSSTFELDGQRVVLVDTPGFDDTTKSDADVLRLVSHYLVTSYESGKSLLASYISIASPISVWEVSPAATSKSSASYVATRHSPMWSSSQTCGAR